MKPFIPTTVYAVLNYLLALVLIASPWLFGFSNVSSAALLMPIFIGWIQLIMAIFADNKLSMIRQFPMQLHLSLDVFMGFLLMVAPWLYSYAQKEPGIPTQFILGAVLFCMGFFTEKSPFLTRTHKAQRQGYLNSTDSSDGRLSI